MKTKSDRIGTVLEQAGSANIVVSWSLNPPGIVAAEELGAASLRRRLEAAGRVREKGFSLAFHFDPIIHYEGWEGEYEALVDDLYGSLEPPFAWISLGTLRSNKDLKGIVEARFPESRIFYGELFLGEDKKLRYPKFLRKEIYRKMKGWIRSHDTGTPVYLCMEEAEVWADFEAGIRSAKDLEIYLTGR